MENIKKFFNLHKFNIYGNSTTVTQDDAKKTSITASNTSNVTTWISTCSLDIKPSSTRCQDQSQSSEELGAVGDTVIPALDAHQSSSKFELATSEQPEANGQCPIIGDTTDDLPATGGIQIYTCKKSEITVEIIAKKVEETEIDQPKEADNFESKYLVRSNEQSQTNFENEKFEEAEANETSENDIFSECKTEATENDHESGEAPKEYETKTDENEQKSELSQKCKDQGSYKHKIDSDCNVEGTYNEYETIQSNERNEGELTSSVSRQGPSTQLGIAESSTDAAVAGLFADVTRGMTDGEDDEGGYKELFESLKSKFTENSELTSEYLMHLLNNSNKFTIRGLVFWCKQILECIINTDNACEIYEQAIEYHQPELEAKCMDVIQADTKTVFASESFKQISNSTLVKIIESEELNISEPQIFDAAIAWAGYRLRNIRFVSDKDYRDLLGPALYRIRFPAMSLEDLANCLAKHKILSDEEELACYRTITLKNENPFITPNQVQFASTPRSGAELDLIRYGPIDMIELKTNSEHKITITITNISDTAVEVKGLYLIHMENASFELFEEVLQDEQSTSVTRSIAEILVPSIFIYNNIPVEAANTKAINGRMCTYMRFVNPKACKAGECVTYCYEYKIHPAYMPYSCFQGPSFMLKKNNIELSVQVKDTNSGNLGTTLNNVIAFCQNKKVVTPPIYCHLGGVVCRKLAL